MSTNKGKTQKGRFDLFAHRVKSAGLKVKGYKKAVTNWSRPQ
jgi:hypothetical protein